MCPSFDCGLCPRLMRQSLKEDASRVRTDSAFATNVIAATIAIILLAFLPAMIEAAVWICTIAGLLAIGGVWLYVYARLWRPYRIRRDEIAARLEAVRQQQRQQVPPSAQQAINGTTVHHHHGHTLALPDNWSPEQIRAFRGE